jgi:hypothetical protein
VHELVREDGGSGPSAEAPVKSDHPASQGLHQRAPGAGEFTPLETKVGSATGVTAAQLRTVFDEALAGLKGTPVDEALVDEDPAAEPAPAIQAETAAPAAAAPAS